MANKRTRDIYLAIMKAASMGRGLSLTCDEVFDLSMDDAIMTRAVNALEEGESTDWTKVDPYKDRHRDPGER